MEPSVQHFSVAVYLSHFSTVCSAGAVEFFNRKKGKAIGGVRILVYEW